ncbi:MAG TPA: hypothetical protein VIT41_08200 [Microlunatus sp.]
MVGALLVAPLIIVVAMWFVLGDTLTEPTPWPLVIAVVAIGLIGDVVLRTFGYRTVVLPHGLSPAETIAQSRLSYQAALFRRMSVAELPLLIALALSFATYGGFYLVLFGAAVTLNLLVVHVWPSQRSVDRTAASLELDGADSRLREALDLPR